MEKKSFIEIWDEYSKAIKAIDDYLRDCSINNQLK